MKSKPYLVGAVALLTTLTAPSATKASTSFTGGQTITIENSASECVIPSTDAASITITSVRVPSDKPWPTWLKNTAAFGVKVDLSIDGPSGTNKQAAFPIAKVVTQIRKDNSAPIIRGTINVAVLKKYKLFDADGNFAHIDMPVTLVRIDDNSGMKSFIDALASVTSGIQIPASPFEPGVRAFGDFVKNVFTKESNQSDDYPNAILGFELVDDTSECPTNTQALRTGAHAQIFTGPKNVAGVIDVNSYASYCYYTSGGEDPNILYEPKTGAQCPPSPSTTTQTLNNPQLIFVVNSYPISKMRHAAVATVNSKTRTLVEHVSANSSDFALFSGAIRASDPITDQNVDLNDLKSLRAKIGATPASGNAEETKVNLSASDRAALELSKALVNCSLVGLPAADCN